MFICVCLKDGGLGWSWGKMCGGGKCDGLASFTESAPGFSMMRKLSSAQVNYLVCRLNLLYSSLPF